MVEPPDTSSTAPFRIIISSGVASFILPASVKASRIVTLLSFSNGLTSIISVPFLKSIYTCALFKPLSRKIGLSLIWSENSSGSIWLRDIGAVASTPETSILAFSPK